VVTSKDESMARSLRRRVSVGCSHLPPTCTNQRVSLGSAGLVPVARSKLKGDSVEEQPANGLRQPKYGLRRFISTTASISSLADPWVPGAGVARG
jgi:hypothetical protein